MLGFCISYSERLNLKPLLNGHFLSYCCSYPFLPLCNVEIPRSAAQKDRQSLPGESIKTPGVSKILIPQYQINDVENCLVLSPICQIRFSNLRGFNRSFLRVEIGDFLGKSPFENLQKRAKIAGKISLCSPS